MHGTESCDLQNDPNGDTACDTSRAGLPNPPFRGRHSFRIRSRKEAFKPLAFAISGFCSTSRRCIFKSELINFGSSSPSPTPSPLSKCQSRRKTTRVMDAPGSACQRSACAWGVIYCAAGAASSSSVVATMAALGLGAWEGAAHASAQPWAGERSLGHRGSDGQKVKPWGRGSWLVAWPRGWVLGAVTPSWF